MHDSKCDGENYELVNGICQCKEGYTGTYPNCIAETETMFVRLVRFVLVVFVDQTRPL